MASSRDPLATSTARKQAMLAARAPLVRPLQESEWSIAFPLLQSLWPHLERASFSGRLREQARRGYLLAGAITPVPTGNRLCGVIGMREVHTLARGGLLQIDDLVVAEDLRRRGVGRALIRYAELEARAAGLQSLFLEAPPTAVPFCRKLGWELTSSPTMLFHLAGAGAGR
jgi:ribosomal protein S18 acetylase RimI-like enzyme